MTGVPVQVTVQLQLLGRSMEYLTVVGGSLILPRAAPKNKSMSRYHGEIARTAKLLSPRLSTRNEIFDAVVAMNSSRRYLDRTARVRCC